MPEVILYTQNDCPPCAFVKQHLAAHRVTFEERNIANPTFRNEMIARDAFSTPFILIDNVPMYQVDLDELNQKVGID
ncbi:glutaredoxin family protein [Staphylococcus lutrae]|uniref:NrdH-redoxin n=1 Tax=Staphylococcus lutrae TaxID=155085 RepID=A0AAC9RSB7_9STAP|nr:glutaredoxin family protein [Staphylococcus lutrae]ARJ51523.1 NrdH-redoxin [Staphylococcus lutrae]PNZ39239.1 glutaredoxin family protein [Staphylococcus lutrae]